ncbi:ribosomal protein S18 acetylase RimI-like enzyme [Paenibacillus shirakamiensis]|uniref:Ribosomal protein S18 acetylase RimI-like enzyme n=1 Tax=Paenibacillus shirakamiensis TaxID=1265935 RepID=A0ABS4JKR0_9BACL|nr:GNAT family N-acetyltransferase [Paenibacillus shirakamiensis]MBP2001194.1 ribosomal protein S18 acetylase RimI-like enzyme [Paenibacillus shirakamiensis]
MLIDVKEYVNRADIASLLEVAVYSDEEELASATHLYTIDSAYQLYALRQEEDWVGVIGYKLLEDDTFQIEHIAVSPEHRDQGYGRALVLELLIDQSPQRLIAKVDEEVVDFYRSIGFVVVSLPSEIPGIEQYLCTYEAEPPTDEA